MSLDDPRIRIRHMIDAAAAALRFSEGRSKDEIVTDLQFQYSVVHCMQIIGEAAYNIPEFVRIQCSDVPWAKIIGMRHHIVHGYPSINYNIIWETLVSELVPLIRRLQLLLEELG